MLTEFRSFIMRGNVVDLAVGLIAGAAFGAVVSSIVANLIDPLIAFLVGTPDFSSALQLRLPELPWADQGAPATLKFGALLTTLITFLGTMAGVFFFVVKPMNAAMTRLSAGETGPDQRDCPECLSSIPAAARRCAHCTSIVNDATAGN